MLRNGAVAHVKELISEAKDVGTVRLFSVRHEFPTERAKFQGQTPGDNQRYELTLNLRPEHYPFWSQGCLNSVRGVDILARSGKNSLDVFDKADKTDATTKSVTLTKDATLGNLLVGKLTNITLPTQPVSEFKLFVDDKALEDLWIAMTWGGE